MAANEWTIATLKEHFDAIAKTLQTALKLQAKEYSRRLKDLNGEQARIAGTQATYVSRELWEKFVQDDREWKSRTELALQGSLPRSEFQTYKETTDRALRIKEGETKGISISAGVIVQIISSVASIGAIIGVVVVLMKAT